MAAPARSPASGFCFAALSLASLVVGLGACDGNSAKNCAALGDEVLPSLPGYALASGVDCKAGGWTDEVERLDDALSVEVVRSSNVRAPLLRTRSGGTVLFLDNELLGLDEDGGIEWQTPYTENRRLEHGTFEIGSNDRIYVSDAFGNDGKIVIFDAATGLQVRQFIVDYGDFGGFSATIAPRGDELWVSHVGGEPGFEGSWISSSLSHYSLEGELLSTVQFDHEEFNQPMVMQWSPSGLLCAAGAQGVYTVDADTGSRPWTLNDTASEDWVNWRALTTTSQSLVVAHGVRSQGGDVPNRWRIVGYALDSGSELWRQEFFGSGSGSELQLVTLDDDAVAFVGGEYGSPDDAQPMIVILDSAGQPVAGERLNVSGDASSVTVDASGSMYVVGGTSRSDSWMSQFERIYWMRRYDAPLW